MKIVCPSCEATYEVPETVLTSRRAVRCARCSNSWIPGDSWHAGAPEPAAEPQEFTHALAPPGDPNAAPASAGAASFDAPSSEAPPDEPPSFAAPHPEITAPDERPGFVAPEPPPVQEPPPVPVDLPPAAARLRQSAASAFAEPLPADELDDAGPTKQPMPAWIASIAALLALGVVAVLFREQVMRFWPASERIYAALGLVQR